MATLTATIWVCTDCYATSVNADPHPRTNNYVYGIKRETYDQGPPTPGRMHNTDDGDLDDCETDHGDDHNELSECETRNFDKSRCDICRTSDAGRRHAMTVWFSEPSLAGALPRPVGFDLEGWGVVAGG